MLHDLRAATDSEGQAHDTETSDEESVKWL